MRGKKKPAEAGFYLAGNLGFEPRTSRLTAERSAAELIAKFGQSGKTRTYDHKVPNLVRYQLRYALMAPSIPGAFTCVNP